jgi:hypothetical protein
MPPGDLDTSFDGNGMKAFTFAAALQPDGRIVVAGSTSGEFAVARLLA